ncbi:MAG: oligosaccharide flippase family protein [Collinsella sp.]|nr:oligosaccharide flippase family protein [Collinsella sp.]
MNLRKLVSDLIVAFGAQGVSFACSVVTTLIVPKILGVEEFAYWQLFIFYTSYVSFFQLGLNDGIYLQHGGESRATIDKGLIRGELRVGLGFQLVAALLIAFYGIFFEADEGRTFVIVAAAVYLILSNITYFISFVCQAINETKVASFSTIVNRCFYLVFLVICVLLRISSFKVYLFFYMLAQGLSLAYCLWQGSFFLKSEPLEFKESVRETVASMKVGIVLTVANISSMLIMGMARVVIDKFWGLSAFGEVSLSLSIVNFALTFITQASMVLFPALRTVDKNSERAYYVKIRDGLVVLLPIAVLFYAPLRWLVGIWLPQYYDSLIYLAFLFPVCLFEVQNSLTVGTFLKVRNEPKALLGINLAALLITLVAQAAAFMIFGTPMAAVIASLCGVASRYAIGTLYLGGVYANRNPKALACMYSEAFVFMVCAYFMPVVCCFVACSFMLVVHFMVMLPEAKALRDKISSFK